jgi:hypothetical protein
MVIAILIALFCFGWAYNGLINSLGNRKEGYVSLLVAGGVLVTLGGAALIDWRASALVLVCFVASGLPMIIGDIWRSTKNREHRECELLEGVGKTSYDTTKDTT